MSRKKYDLSLSVRVFRIMLVLGISLLYVTTVLSNQTPPNAALVGNEACMDCHEEVGEAFHKTIHGLAFSTDGSRGELTCESCHGPGSAHVEEQDPELIINPAKDDQFGEQTLCVTCHNTAMFDDWAFSSHNTGDINHEKGNAGTLLRLPYRCPGQILHAVASPGAGRQDGLPGLSRYSRRRRAVRSG